jgi:ComF family protein
MPIADLGLDDAPQRCGACLDQAPAYDATFAAVDYAAPVDQLVIALKFGSRLAMAPLFAKTMRDALLRTPTGKLPDVLLPIPLGAGRLQRRGYNQALEIAKPLSKALGIPLQARWLQRSRDTHAQSSLHPDERKKNVRNAFALAPEHIDHLQDLHVGLIDDVMTTGETLHEVAATLKAHGVARVTNFVFARTLLK